MSGPPEAETSDISLIIAVSERHVGDQCDGVLLYSYKETEAAKTLPWLNAVLIRTHSLALSRSTVNLTNEIVAASSVSSLVGEFSSQNTAATCRPLC